MRTHLLIGLMFIVVPAGFMAACSSTSSAPDAAVSGSKTGIFLSDIHFNPLMDPTLVDSLAQAPAAQWDAIFATSAQTACATYQQDTNFALLQSALGAMKQQVPNPDIIFISGDLLMHEFQMFFTKTATNNTQAAYVAFVYTTEQYLALKLTQTFPNAQIVPTLGDWDTAGGTTASYADPNFLTAFAAAWNTAVNRNGGAPDFQTTFAAGGYYSTTFPIVPNGRLIGLYTQPWAAECTAAECAPAAGALGTVELQWLTAQFASARSQGQRVWLLGHIPPGIDANSTEQNSATDASCPSAIVPFWADAYSSQLYALFAEYRDVITFGIFAHEHFDDLRIARDSSSNLLFGIKLPPSITPLHNNPAFVQFTYDPAAGAISDTTTWYLTNLAATPTAVSAAWGSEYTFDATYGQTAFDSNGVAGAVSQIMTQPGAQSSYTNYYPSSDPAFGFTTFLPYGCALNNLTVADYTTCFCGN